MVYQLIFTISVTFVLEHAIDEEVFSALNNEMLKDLIPQIGIRYKFKKLHNARYKDDCKSTVTVEGNENLSPSVSNRSSPQTPSSVTSTAESIGNYNCILSWNI